MYINLFGITIDLGSSAFKGGKSLMRRKKRNKKDEDALDKSGNSKEVDQEVEGGWAGACVAYSATGLNFAVSLSSMFKVAFNPLTGLSCMEYPADDILVITY